MPASFKKSKYHREISPGVFVDVYDVLRAFSVTEPELQHLIKKALAAGQRGMKSFEQDIKEIHASAQCAVDNLASKVPVDDLDPFCIFPGHRIEMAKVKTIDAAKIQGEIARQMEAGGKIDNVINSIPKHFTRCSFDGGYVINKETWFIVKNNIITKSSGDLSAIDKFIAEKIEKEGGWASW